MISLLDRATGRFDFSLVPLADGSSRTAWIAGHPDKVYSEVNSGKWIAFHSVVGEESKFQDGVPDRFLSSARKPNGEFTDYAAASALGVIRKSGELIQMYPWWKSTWTSGGRIANINTWAFEVEGGFDPHNEPWTPEQLVTGMLICAAWTELHDGEEITRDYTRPVNGVLVEHNEFCREFGYKMTACPSGRNQQLYDALDSGQYDLFIKRRIGMWVPDDQWRALVRSVFAGGEEVRIDAQGNRILKSEAERDANAAWRMNERASGRGVSVSDHATSAWVQSKQALDQSGNAGGNGGNGSVGKHTHKADAIITIKEN